MKKLELTPFEHTHLCIALEAHIDSLKTYCIDLKKRESPDEWDESSMQKDIKQAEALYERCMNLDKKTYLVDLYLYAESSINTRVIANNKVEAEQIARNNFYNKNIKELNEQSDLYDWHLSEDTGPIAEEEE